ncbi:transporter substrate-binding domain-containing protein [Dongshaea marina]|uniref:transporter substrate-binding domain-containing protein n=1 Tax=Dongshaea marina TaxID=2047966 RepID=UPI000D3E801A|nr:transporter substrate-binding domain-containing protein [Dongshaea marina]
MAPWNSESLEGGGISPQITTAVLASQGITAHYHFLPNWEQAFEDAKQGEYQATISWSYSEERAKYFYYSDPAFTTSVYWFYLKDNPKAPLTGRGSPQNKSSP